MDIIGVLIGVSCLITITALLVTLYGGKNTLRFSGKTQAKEEPNCQQIPEIHLTTEEPQRQRPDVGNYQAIILPDTQAIGDADIDTHQLITHIPFGILPKNDE